MILHSIRISCSPNSDPNLRHLFLWSSGDDVFSVECAIAKLQEWVDEHKTPKAIALDQPPNLNAS